MYPRPINESLEQFQDRESRDAARQAKADAMARFCPPEETKPPARSRLTPAAGSESADSPAADSNNKET